MGSLVLATAVAVLGSGRLPNHFIPEACQNAKSTVGCDMGRILLLGANLWYFLRVRFCLCLPRVSWAQAKLFRVAWQLRQVVNQIASSSRGQTLRDAKGADGTSSTGVFWGSSRPSSPKTKNGGTEPKG
jgi:hypothetical protein